MNQRTSSAVMPRLLHTWTFKLTSSEVLLLTRALRIYARTYQDLRAKTNVPWEKEELKQYEEAADRLCTRLLQEGK